MDSPNPPTMRVLTRPPPAPKPTPPPTPTPTPASSSDPTPPLPLPSLASQPRSPDGVVVVGFIARRPDDSSHLINQVLDSNVFGSGRMDRVLSVDKEEVEGWFRRRRISYHHEEDKGILFLQFCPTSCPVFDGSWCSGSGSDEVVDEPELGNLQGLLFMFSVCHVIIYILEGSRIDTQILKKFRILQAAKHSLIPYVKSLTTPSMPLRAHSSSSSRPSTSTTASSTSPGRSSGLLSRNASAISLMSGLGSYTSLFPGQCTPVTLFVFIDDISDAPNPSSSVEESVETSSSLNSSARPALPGKGSGSVVVLARPISKSEGGFKKKLQSSLEAQIRFLIKKCRILSGHEGGHAGARSGGVSSSASLFSLDASRAVVLLERLNSQKGESLEFASSLVEDVLNGKATSDSLLLETHSQSSYKEDIVSVKEFIYKQSDSLRGRGGLVANTNSASAAGVGIVAVAAAVAAASAASGKAVGTPELPSLDIWVSSSQLILYGILSAKSENMDETEIGRRKQHRNTITSQAQGIASRSNDPLAMALSWLESGRGLNRKFSNLWCERALPAAKDIYLKDLPAFYPTLQHEAHLKKAMHAFHSMVRGPAVEPYAKRLEEECTSIWKSGRQLCDAVSLTGKPCMHQRHDTETGESPSGATTNLHSSGYGFLHACSCGRSRRLRSDPFDFESANSISSCFLECDKLLPGLQLPERSGSGAIKPSSWSLIRIGGSKYYEPSKGLLQSGFSATERFLFKWTIFQEKQKMPSGLPVRTLEKHSYVSRSSTGLIADLSSTIEMKKAGPTEYSVEVQTAVENPDTFLEIGNFNGNKISFGRGLPNFTMKKPFAEVVAGSATLDSGFPPLQQRKQPSSVSGKGMKKNKASDQTIERTQAAIDRKSTGISSVKKTLNVISSNGGTSSDPFLQIGSNVVPIQVSSNEKVKLNPGLKNVIVYVGFEHECPRGHRFLLNPEHLNQLGSPYSLVEESQIPHSAETSEHTLADSSNLIKNGGRGKIHQKPNGVAAVTAVNKVRNKDKPKEVPNGNLHKDGQTPFSMHDKNHNQKFLSMAGYPVSVKDIEASFHSVSLDDGGCAFSMLNRNLPVYMNCPHCKSAKSRKDPPEVKFASSISQLQRIFMVTPPFPIVLATCPVIQFETSCLLPPVLDHEQKLQFSIGCQVILPPESFVTLRLPFIYGAQIEDGSLHPLNPFEDKPEQTAWIIKGTTLQLTSKGKFSEEGLHK
ncbi:hypothetical protein SLE2022_001650 [Rubroshorea leprosula]